MTWNVNIAGHQGKREYGSDDHKAHEGEVARRFGELARELREEHDVTMATFSGNTLQNVNLLKEAE